MVFRSCTKSELIEKLPHFYLRKAWLVCLHHVVRILLSFLWPVESPYFCSPLHRVSHLLSLSRYQRVITDHTFPHSVHKRIWLWKWGKKLAISMFRWTCQKMSTWAFSKSLNVTQFSASLGSLHPTRNASMSLFWTTLKIACSLAVVDFFLTSRVLICGTSERVTK